MHHIQLQCHDTLHAVLTARVCVCVCVRVLCNTCSVHWLGLWHCCAEVEDIHSPTEEGEGEGGRGGKAELTEHAPAPHDHINSQPTTPSPLPPAH